MADILVLNGEVIWNGDEIYITGKEDAIRQEAYLRAICDLGESVFYPEYGSRLFSYLGQADTETNKALLEAEAKETLLKTEGIIAVEEIELRSTVIEGLKKPYIYAKYKTENEGGTQEGTFKFLV